MWSALEGGPKSFEELCELVMADYEIDRANCEEDISALLTDLIKEKLVVDES